VRCGKLGEEEKALNIVEIIEEKTTVRIRVCDFQVGGLTHLFNFSGLVLDFWHLVAH